MKIEDIVKFIREETGCSTCIYGGSVVDKDTGEQMVFCNYRGTHKPDGHKCTNWSISVDSSDVDLEVEATYTQSLSVKREDNV